MNETCCELTASGGRQPTVEAPLPSTSTRGSRPPLAEVLERFERQAIQGTCNTGRYRCSYHVWGQGPPLIIIPGLAINARSLALLCAHLADHFRCIVYDLPVGGVDGATLSRCTHTDLVDDSFALLDHLHIQQSYVLGFSFGSTIALGALGQHPERLPRGILVGGFAQRRLAAAEVLLARLLNHCRVPMRKLPWHNAILRRSHYPPFAARAAELWPFFLECVGGMPVAAVAQRALALHALDLTPHLSAIHQPVLVVSGDEDPLVSPSSAGALAKGLPSAMHVELPGCGHYAPLTHPAELTDLIWQFLSPPLCVR
jgi:pimeloyl-ACP methyl ester carboxylesterase